MRTAGVWLVFWRAFAVAAAMELLASASASAQDQDTGVATVSATISLRSRQFVPLARSASQALRSRDVGAMPQHLFLQFTTPIDAALQQQLTATGIRVLRFVPHNAVMALVPADVELDTVSGLRWSGPLEAADKVSVESRAQLRNGGETRHLVLFHPDVTLADQEATLARVLTSWQRPVSGGASQVIVETTSTSLFALANQDNVAWVVPASEALAADSFAPYCESVRIVAGLALAEYATYDEGWDGPGRGQAELGAYFGTGAGLGGTEWVSVQRALDEWARYAALKWVQKGSPRQTRTIDLAFLPACHYIQTGEPDDPCFDPDVLGHAYFPSADETIAGDVHFNSQDFRWKTSGSSIGSSINVFDVALHELGHSLGLDHSSDPNSVMYAYLSRSYNGLQSDDIRAIQSIYRAAPYCDFTVTPTTRSITAAGGIASFNISTEASCAWTATTSVSWVRLPSPASGTGPATVSYQVDANTAVTTRSAQLTVAGVTVTVDQAPAPCTYTLSAPQTTIGAGATTASVSIATQTSCQWSLSAPAWLKPLWLQTTGSGPATVTFSVLPNLTSSSRIGTVTVSSSTLPITQSASADSNVNGLPDQWESFYSSGGTLNPSGDTDGDGTSNGSEFSGGTHPTATFARYFAEGATSTFFRTRFSLVLASGNSTAHVLLRFLLSNGQVIAFPVPVPAHQRVTVEAQDVPGLGAAEFATVVESDLAVVADRTMTWDATGYGMHTETAIAAPATTWYLAEGSTGSSFQLFYLLQNANDEGATVQVEYLRASPLPPVVKTYHVGPHSRFNVWVNTESDVAGSDVSAVITSDRPIVVERAMYLNPAGQMFRAGHESAGVTQTSRSWFFAEGATGDYFDTFVLMANPGDTQSVCDTRFLLPDGSEVVESFYVDPRSRGNIWIDAIGGPLANTAVSTSLDCTEPIVAERAMWWPGPSAAWGEAHNAFGVAAAGTVWVVADGEQGGPFSTETYLLIANTSAFDAVVEVELQFEDGSTSSKQYPVAARSRLNVAVGAAAAAGGFGSTSANKRFSAVVRSLVQAGPGVAAQVVVERSLYSNANGVVWAAGSNSLGTRVE
ncbi:MAG: matrixin family metalloprotease [Vicinamibacterales bacterium]